MACSAALGQPLTYRDDVLTVIPGTLPDTELKACFDKADAVAVMKLGRNFIKVRAVLTELGLADRARYVERATMARQRILRLQAAVPDTAPHSSMIVLPRRRPG